ncbi:hypothetical protein IQ247_02725 [Plectonema cf. radiosum LEGE 06105]|uniref:Uncharacterized protein n=1 Tax=Plectonema cf. radiosum LEGE 06105 TaxID=945769 RepID=A0A8J7F5G4_9CYAN|nr:hypothetical protein [Plectonema radiosum]MBE9211639.1 hypothetical protein [Plectonema cf. radiosum LEGE 06105]
MLTHQRKPVYLSLISTDLPVESVVEAAGTLYQKDSQRFHLLLNAPPLKTWQEAKAQNSPNTTVTPAQTNARVSGSPRILWLEISPYRVTMTMQGNPHLSYRHFWEKGIYGMSRYWLPSESLQNNQPIRLKNFTRNLTLSGHPLPEHLRVEYELWSGKLQLGNYILNLEIQN